MNKKAFEVQFNWIFVLVAGAAILLFFTVVVVKQKNVSETSTKASVLKSIEAIVTGASVSTDTTNIIDMPNSNIEISCGRISVGGISRQYNNLVLFAPSLVKGDRLITQTLAFNAPYRATNLLYMTSPQLRYIIIGNSNLAKDINKTLPAELRKEFYPSMQQIQNSNNYKVRFVIFGDMMAFPKSLERMPDSDVTAVRINGDTDKGVLEFWQKNGNSWLAKGSSAYIGKASLIGAIYTDSLNAYECNIQNTFLRLNLVTKIYSEKTKKLVQKLALSSRQAECSKFYNNALAHLTRISAASSNFNKENVDDIAETSKLLAGENKNAQVYSCTLIY
ncbi:hypothetical protein HYX02_07880 [Candidatus Woesearchaeota archaeon]|nr:hypothetical protein [Candidatus Woesearchaeota archaeon]